jgi:uncharacterized protein
MSPSPDRPLNDAERDRMDAMISRFRSQSAMNNAEQIDGFFAALICSPEIAKPSQYLPEIWGGEMADEEAFDDQHQFQDFLSLLMRHWNSIVCILEKGEIFGPLLFQDEHGGPLIPIMILAHEHDPDPEMRPYKDNIDAGLREKLILGISGAVTAIYRYFAPQRRSMAAGLGAEGTANRRAKLKIGRNDPCRCGSGKKYKHW